MTIEHTVWRYHRLTLLHGLQAQLNATETGALLADAGRIAGRIRRNTDTDRALHFYLEMIRMDPADDEAWEDLADPTCGYAHVQLLRILISQWLQRVPSLGPTARPILARGLQAAGWTQVAITELFKGKPLLGLAQQTPLRILIPAGTERSNWHTNGWMPAPCAAQLLRELQHLTTPTPGLVPGLAAALDQAATALSAADAHHDLIIVLD